MFSRRMMNMDNMMIQAGAGQAAAGYAGLQKTERTEKPEKGGSGNYGRTVGNPQLSEEGEKYYNELKKKYGNMEFILVSEDMKAQTHAQAGSYANPNRMVVLIDTDKIERMAQDENYRNMYEGIIKTAAARMTLAKTSLGSRADCVKSQGVRVNDKGLSSLFAVVDKTLALQKKRLEKKAARKAEEKKKSAKAAQEKRAEKKKEAALEEKRQAERGEDTVTVTASTWEELIEKINRVIDESTESEILTEEEKNLGQHIDFRW